MSDLVEFYRARLDQDEQAAHAVVRFDYGVTDWCDNGDPISAHIGRHDPARVLREVEAGRRLIRRYELAVKATSTASSFVSGQDDGYRQACLDAIKDAIEVHADHPDYREEWRP